VKYNELKTKSAKELQAMDTKLREELFHLRIKSSTAQLEKKSQIRQVRRDLARIQTKLTSLKSESQAKA
jgi:large subunit ribosomal protein L29